jgi:hypothetical protein
MKLQFDLGSNFYTDAEFQSQQNINLLLITIAKKLRLEIDRKIEDDLLIINNLVKIRFIHAINNNCNCNCDILVTGISFYDLVLGTNIIESSSIDCFAPSYNLEIGLATSSGENYLKYIFPDSLLL